MIYLGSDHGGFAAKEELKKRMKKARITFRDLGPASYDPDDDYPFFAAKVGRAVAQSPSHKGVLICRSNTGVAIAANKIKGVRAVGASHVWTARRAKRDENANVLCLASEDPKAEPAWTIVRGWLKQGFRNAERDRRRLKQIRSLEHGQ
ncbi:MAG: RpiB/LacA/LacB family sugar-phosphate isomerase [bacterium]|nr:RpiB/LacA/LacB family sugar-phosphate isomerase [bacterium]